MPAPIDSFSTSKFLPSYAQGASVNGTPRVQNLLAPIVPVPEITGRYKKHTKEARTVLPNSLRDLGGKAVQLTLNATTDTYTCEVHALDCPVDGVWNGSWDWLLPDAVNFLADVEEQISERDTITKAIAAAGDGSSSLWNNVADPIKLIDAEILTLVLQAKSDVMGVIFGSTAWDIFKNNPTVQKRCPGDISYARFPNLFHTAAEFQTSYAFHDANPLGLSESAEFMFPASTVLIFARSRFPNRRDPSFMKTFSARPDQQEARIVPTTDGRGVIVTIDWSKDIKVTNDLGVTRINVVTS